MWYVKNVPTWERLARMAVGLVAVVFTVMSWGSPIAMGAGVLGAVLSMTGLLGFCPMCALVGRKLPGGR